MQLDVPNLISVDDSVIKYINQLQNNYEAKIRELEFKYFEIKERYDLLIYKRFVRSAEQLLADEKQQLLFNEESKKAETTQGFKKEELTEVKPHKRKKRGRKPIDPSIKREEEIIDIPESEKTCACGAVLTKIGGNFGLKSERKTAYNTTQNSCTKNNSSQVRLPYMRRY
jgi:hypothetical protein